MLAEVHLLSSKSRLISHHILKNTTLHRIQKSSFTFFTLCLMSLFQWFNPWNCPLWRERREAFSLMVFHLSEKTFAPGWKDLCTQVEKPLHPSGKTYVPVWWGLVSYPSHPSHQAAAMVSTLLWFTDIYWPVKNVKHYLPYCMLQRFLCHFYRKKGSAYYGY